jgi:hypothetical protein
MKHDVCTGQPHLHVHVVFFAAAVGQSGTPHRR